MSHSQEVLLKEFSENVYYPESVAVFLVSSKERGFEVAEKLLTALVDTRTVLYLSGGKTPKELYTALSSEDRMRPGAVGLVDERYGKRFHETSNEKMLKDSGFLRSLELRGIPFYPMLQEGLSREETAEAYDQKFRELNNTYPKSVATLGVGLDGHTAGIAGNRSTFHNPMFESSEKDLLVSDFDDSNGMFKERVSMTFLGLSMLDVLLVLVFGEEKKEALEKMFEDGSEEEVPSRFLLRPEIAKKTILITDQDVV